MLSNCRHIKNGDERFARFGSKNNYLPGSKSALPSDYHPELDDSPELNAVDSAYYQSLIGILRWIVEMGRVDICLETSVMSSCLALPREDHLRKLFQIFSYLKTHTNPHLPNWWNSREEKFPKKDWKGTPYYKGSDESLKDSIPENAPEPLGQGIVMSAWVDSDHAGDKVTRRSRTGFLVYLQSSLVYWFSKKQGSVETSSFGSEFVAIKQYTEYIRGLRYKLRMMGIRCDDCCYIFGDNQYMLRNSSDPESQLRKKSNSVAYHFVREGTAKDEWRCAYVRSEDNHSDLLSKVLPAGPKREKHCEQLLHWIYSRKKSNRRASSDVGQSCG